MACTKKALLVFITFIVISALVGRIHDAIQYKVESNDNFNRASTDVAPGDEYRHLMFFVQVTDTHLSVVSDPSRVTDLKEFIRDTIMNVIKPPVVVMTGDIADSVLPGFLRSGQVREEWQLYWRTIYETGVTRQLAWLDIRGNHDNLNLESPESNLNFYRVYSVQGRTHPHSYSYVHRDGNDTYTFIGVDTCTDPGVKRPFNFVGSLPQDRLAELKRMKEESQNSNLTIWFGHHPTSSVASSEIRDLMRQSGPYLCGHYHTLGGLFREVYLLQPSGALELELADWKHGRMYRVAAVDHGMFSFVDVHHGDWPVILVTNPKSALLSMPSIEPLGRMSRSSHVRALVFSREPVASLRYQLDGGSWTRMRRVGDTPLWVAPWETRRISGGLHELRVEALGADDVLMGAPTTVTFSLDGTQPSFSLSSRLILQAGISGFQALFGIVLCVCLLPLCWLKLSQTINPAGSLVESHGHRHCGCCHRLLLRLHLLVSVDFLFWPVVCMPIYVALGPWFVGELVTGHIGICFLWGTYLWGTLLPSGLSYFFATIFILACYLPMVGFLAGTLWRRRKSLLSGEAMPKLASSWGLLLVVCFQCTWASFFVIAYGYLVVLLGFVCVGAPVLSLVLWQVARTLPRHRMEKFERLTGGPTRAASHSSKPGSS